MEFGERTYLFKIAVDLAFSQAILASLTLPLWLLAFQQRGQDQLECYKFRSLSSKQMSSYQEQALRSFLYF